MELIPLTKQPDDSKYLWKYMSFQKFMYFIINKCIYYSRLDQLEDAHEGVNQKYLSKFLFHKQNEKDPVIDTTHAKYEEFFFSKPLVEINNEFTEKQKKYYVTCWITGNRESAGMWNMYSEPGGIAIRISYELWINVLQKKEYDIEQSELIKDACYGIVEYKDFLNTFGVSSKSFKVKRAAFRKDISFEHEKEFRICLRVNNPFPQVGLTQKLNSFKSIPFEIIAHPKTNKWQYANIVKVVETFAPTLAVCNSELKFR